MLIKEQFVAVRTIICLSNNININVAREVEIILILHFPMAATRINSGGGGGGGGCHFDVESGTFNRFQG